MEGYREKDHPDDVVGNVPKDARPFSDYERDMRALRLRQSVSIDLEMSYVDSSQADHQSLTRVLDGLTSQIARLH